MKISIFDKIKNIARKNNFLSLPLGGVGGGLLLVVGGGLLLCSCSNEEQYPYKPASPVAADCVGAYFPNSNSSEFIKADTDENTLNIAVVRENTNGAVSIPVEVISKTDNIVIPSTVDFEADSCETTLVVTYTDLETTPKFDIRLKEEYTNPYKEKEGSSEFSANVYRLNLVSDSINIRNYATNYTSIFDHTTAKQYLYQMGNENKFIWRNFYGSGIDLKFKIDGHFDSTDFKECYGNIIPLNHFYDDGAYGWWLMVDEDVWADNATWEYASWKVEGTDNEVADWMYFYYEYEGSSYFYIDLRPRETKSGVMYGDGYIWTGFVDSYSDGVDNSAFYLYYK